MKKKLEKHKMDGLFLEAGRAMGLEFLLDEETGKELFVVDEKEYAYPDLCHVFNSAIFKANSSKKITETLLTLAGVNCIEAYELSKLATQAYGQAVEIFHTLGRKKVVVRGDKGTAGYSTFFAENEEELLVAVKTLLERGVTPLISPYYFAEYEYRVIVFNGEVQFAVKKQLNTKNGRHNLSSGAASSVADEVTLAQLKGYCQPIIDLFGLGFAGIDVMDTEEGFKTVELSVPNMFRFSEASPTHKEMVISLLQDAFRFYISQHLAL